MLQGTGLAPLYHVSGMREIVVERLVDNPQEGEHAECADEGRELGDVVECGDEPQAAEAEEEECDALPEREVGVVAAVGQRHILEGDAFGQLARHEGGGNSPGDEAGQRHPCAEMAGGDGSHVPEQQTVVVADDGESPADVRAEDDDGAEDGAVAAVRQYLVHEEKHHQRRGEIVEVGADEEREEGGGPEQAAAAASLYPLRYEIEAAVAVENLYDGHRGDEEEHYL